MEEASYESFDQCDPHMISGEPRSTYSSVESTHTSSQKWRVESSQAVSRNGTSRSLKYATHVSRDDLGVESGTRNRKTRFSNSGITEDSPDPFAFYNDDSEPSRWESRSGRMNKSLSRDGRATMIGSTDTSDFVSVTLQESNNVEYRHSQETSCSSTGDEDKSNLLAECLLTAIKVFKYC